MWNSEKKQAASAQKPLDPVDPLDSRRFNMVEPADYRRWLPDFLGPGFEQLTFPLPADSEGECVATLVRHVAASDPALPGAPSPTFAFLAVHGWNDYFYQTHLARRVATAGGAFYALDLRRFGRSLRPGQTTGFIDSLDEYDAELAFALNEIESLHVPIVLYGHSMGGLVTSLWANRHPGRLRALVLNSPWLEFQSHTAVRLASMPALATMNLMNRHYVIPKSDSGFYQRVLTAWRDNEPLLGARTEAEIDAGVSHLQVAGEHSAPASPDFAGVRVAHPWAPPDSDDPFWTTGWQPDPRFRVFPSWDARSGWFSAILSGHAEVARGLDIDCPVLVLTSDANPASKDWNEEYMHTDCVLDLKQLWRRAGLLGSDVRLRRIAGAIHDVILSEASAREEALAVLERFLAEAGIARP